MKSFQFPTVGKRPSSSSTSSTAATKKELEEQRKRLDEQAAAEAFEEYVAVFQDSGGKGGAGGGGGGGSKVWVKAGTYDAGKRQEDTKDKGKLYKPVSRFEKDVGGGSSAVAVVAVPETERPDKPGSKKRQSEKKKSNLEIFKEELKIIQEEREERHRLKRMLGLQEVIKLPPKPGDDLRASLSLELDDIRMMGGSGSGGGGAGIGGGGGGGSIDDGDPNTTNIYLGNLPTKISEQQLMEVFGKYGPLASVKVMWPRTEEEKARNRLSGFVAFMSRRDGERALKNLAGKEILGSEIKLGWGKAVPIPAYPVYIPPVMLELTMPPPLSGLPFNGQVERRERGKLPPPGTPYPTDPKGKEEFERVLYSATVKVVMPTDRALLSLIHRMVEFVLREGPMFEAMVMNKEISNPQFRFLFENQSPAHVYYRWKLYSILQGDSTQRWRTEEFRMFKGGSVWRPPKLNPFTQGMPDDLIPEDEREIMVGSLSNAQRTRLERMLRRLTPDRHKVAEVMIFSIEHSESTEEICTCIKESLCNPLTPLQKKIARLYVINDVLHNCTVKGMNAFGYRKGFKAHLPRIFQELGGSYEAVKEGGGGGGGKEGTVGESFKQRVMGCFKAWDEWGVYSSEFLIRLQNIFLGLVGVAKDEPTNSPTDSSSAPFTTSTSIPSQKDPNKSPGNSDDDDDDEETARANINVHRQKLHKKAAPPRAQLPPQSAMKLVKALQSADEPPEISEELDGVPMDEGEEEEVEGDGSRAAVSSKFIPSKWEELDPEQVKAGAVTTTSKWDLFEEKVGKEEGGAGVLVGYGDDEDEDIDGVPMDEEEGEREDGGGVGGEEGRRARLREVEMKVLAFQDELERRGVVGDGVDLVREYREKLLRRVTDRPSHHRRHSSSRKGRRREYDDDDDDEGDRDDDEGLGEGDDGERSPTTSTTSSSSLPPAKKRTRVPSSPGNNKKNKHDNPPPRHHHHHHHHRRSRSNRSRSRSPSQQARRRGRDEEEEVGGRSRSRDRRR